MTLNLKFFKANRLFYITVIIPTLLAVVYFGFLASDVYISESRFVVKSPEAKRPTGFGALLETAGVSSSGGEISAARSFVISRDALASLERQGGFQKSYERGNISLFDRFNPTGFYGSFEDLYLYFQTKVRVEIDPVTSITSLTVRSYTPDDAFRINSKLLQMAEATVNRLSIRGRDDLVRFAQVEVDESKARAQAAALALAAYRNEAGVVDPEKQAAVQMQMISKLQDELIATRTQLRQIQTFTPRNPQIDSLRVRADELSRQMREQVSQVAGGSRSLANTAARYQAFALESQYADKQLTAALASLQDARNDARRKQAYVERIVLPNRPDAPLEPRRLRGIFTTLVLGLISYGILSMLLAGVKEHTD